MVITMPNPPPHIFVQDNIYSGLCVCQNNHSPALVGAGVGWGRDPGSHGEGEVCRFHPADAVERADFIRPQQITTAEPVGSCKSQVTARPAASALGLQTPATCPRDRGWHQWPAPKSLPHNVQGAQAQGRCRVRLAAWQLPPGNTYGLSGAGPREPWGGMGPAGSQRQLRNRPWWGGVGRQDGARPRAAPERGAGGATAAVPPALPRLHTTRRPP